MSTGRLVIVTGKGGVGKTTVAAALGAATAAEGRRALLVEIARPGRSCSRHLGLAHVDGYAAVGTARCSRYGVEGMPYLAPERIAITVWSQASESTHKRSERIEATLLLLSISIATRA